MTGSLQVKKEYYYMAINTYVDGKRRIKWISTGIPAKKGNKRKAEQLLNQTLVNLEQGIDLLDSTNKSDLLFTQVAEMYFQHIAHTVDGTTVAGYRQLATCHVLPFFDSNKIKMVDVDRKMLQKYFDEQLHSGNLLTGGGLASSSIQHIRSVVFSICKYAVFEDIIPVNPCQNINTPKVDVSCSSYYNEEQLNQLFIALHESFLYPIVKLTVMYGLRRSEVLGLKWDAFDFCSNTFTIQHIRTMQSVPVAKDKTKNKSSHRSFPMTPEVLDILNELKHKQEEDKKIMGSCYHDSGYIFTKVNGEPYNPNFITVKFSKQLAENSLPHIRFHDLRHSCASYLVNNGFNLKDVQEWMGHANISTTANIYSHLDISRKHSMAEKMSDSFLRS